MARYIGPKCKKERREGEKLGLRGRCHGAKCATTKRNYAPGQHGPKKMNKLTEYGLQLRAKQKVRLMYGVLEKQFSRYMGKALRQQGATGDNLLRLLESRIDNVLYRAGYGTSRSMSRQLVTHRHIVLNGQRVKTPSIHIKVGDVITIRDTEKAKILFDEIYKQKIFDAPEWLAVDEDKHVVKVLAEPDPARLGENVDTQLIVEFYSR